LDLGCGKYKTQYITEYEISTACGTT